MCSTLPLPSSNSFFNRTIVELKLWKEIREGGEKTFFNRTIVELKRGIVSQACRLSISLIEPLWNWNDPGSGGVRVGFVFNRTIVELKLAKHLNLIQDIEVFNRTIVELKLYMTSDSVSLSVL